MRASTALMQMINQDLSAREQQRDVVLEQARRDFESFRNEDLLGYVEVKGRRVPVVAVSVMDFGGGFLMTSMDPFAERLRGSPTRAGLENATTAAVEWNKALNDLSNNRAANSAAGIEYAQSRVDYWQKKYYFELDGRAFPDPGSPPFELIEPNVDDSPIPKL